VNAMPATAASAAHIRRALADDSRRLAALHARSFDDAWDEAAIRGLLAGPATVGFLAILDPGAGNADAGLLLAHLHADEAEVLTLAVAPGLRRQGLAVRLVEALAADALGRGAGSIILEVAADNSAALALYRRLGFVEAGRRRGYYARAGRAAVDALVLRSVLTGTGLPLRTGGAP